LISINILCVIIVGGMGSIPGVIVGAAALVGLPELLREFAEYRPPGLWRGAGRHDAAATGGAVARSPAAAGAERRRRNRGDQ